MLCNIVKTLPESIGKLKNLSFLNLKDNKNLNSLPKSIDNLPDLEFIHLGGTGIKTMPEFIKNKFDTMDPNSGIYYLST
jgi:Leucine-rich repeat (LRR) protein